MNTKKNTKKFSTLAKPSTINVVCSRYSIVFCVLLAACSGSSTNEVDLAADSSGTSGDSTSLTLYPSDGAALTPRIRRTTAGVPHIEGDSISAVTAGLGYVQAEDNVCILADGFLKVRGERAEFFGPGPDNAYIKSDFSYLAIALRAKAEIALDNIHDETRAAIDGYVAGYNHYLETSDNSSWDTACRDQAWVRKIDAVDLLAYNLWLATLRSSEEFAEFGDLLVAVPPGESAEPTVVLGFNTTNPSTDTKAMTLGHNSTVPWQDRNQHVASNAWSIGSDLTQNARGALLANPHFPYTGSLRFYQSHLSIPNELNVMGAGLLGVPIPQIAYNDNLAWTHTVSSSVQFTVYRLELDPDDPMAYIKDGESNPITARSIQIKVANGTDTPTILERNIYDSSYGPMLSMSSVTDGALPSWGTDNFAFSYRDAIDNVDFLHTWISLAKANNLSEVKSVFENCGSTLWTNSIFTDKVGNAFYIDSSAVPNLSPETQVAIDAQLNDDLYADLFYGRFVILDGSESRDDWVEGECEGRVPYENLPKLQRSDYVQNSNDSYWATNPAEVLVGSSKLFGEIEVPLNERTRMGLSMLQNPMEAGFSDTPPGGDDAKFDARELLDVIWNNRAFYAEIFLPEVRKRCNLIGDTAVVLEDSSSRSVADACAVLANWSGNYNVDAVGAHVFRVMLGAGFERGAIRPSIDFDSADPVNTPNGLSDENRGTEIDPILQALVVGVRRLESASIPLDATLGSVQTYTPTGGASPGGSPFALANSQPWHGGNGGLDGAFNAVIPVNSPVQQNTVLPKLFENVIPGTGFLSADLGIGWRIERGAGYLMGLQFNDDGPEAWGLLTYGQSTNPNSAWYAEQSAAYSSKTPRQFLFKEADIAAAVLPNGESSLSIERD